MNIYLDIETIPCQSEKIKKEIAEKITAPGQYKKEESINQWMKENRESAADVEWRKTGLDGGLGQICCISVAIDNSEIRTFFSEDWKNSEAEIIKSLFDFLSVKYDPSRMMPPIFVGHNIVNFDLRFIFQRSVILGIKPPRFIPFNGKSWDKSIFDTMTEWAGHGNRVSLSKLCKVLCLNEKGYETGEDIDGSKVWDFVKEGKISTVAKYCEGDVSRVRAIHKKMTFS